MRLSEARPFSEMERACEYEFSYGGPYWHLFTKGTVSGIIFRDEKQFKFGMTLMAVCAADYNVNIITFAIMNNHIHIIIEGVQTVCVSLFEKFRFRLKRYFTRLGIVTDFSQFYCTLLPINDLKSMRNEIAYVNRNGYIAHERYTPFSYPWGAGYLYFNELVQLEKGIPFNDLTYRQKRMICRSHSIILPDNYRSDGQMILPASYCFFKKGQSFYRNARHYFMLVSKNVEAYGGIAKCLDDNVFLTDEELYSVIAQLSVNEYNVKQPTMLPSNAKLKMARLMNYDYHATNGQIRRILKLDQSLVEELFPLKTK